MLEEERDGVRAEIRDRIAVWTLARADRHNALSLAMVRRLGALAQAARDTRAIRAVIITGEGARAFCAGADLKERRTMSLDEVRAFLSACEQAFLAIDRLDKPVVAALNGVAFGGGLELALACDLRVAASTALMGLTETSLGIIPGAGGTQRLPRVVGPARAREMILLSQRLDAAEAQRIGLVHRVAPADHDALSFALQLAEAFRDGAPLALAAALDALDAAEDALERGLAFERSCYERVLVSTDRIEALEAFAAKRKPVFRGE